MVTSKELEDAIRAKIQGVTSLVVSDVSGGCGQVCRRFLLLSLFPIFAARLCLLLARVESTG